MAPKPKEIGELSEEKLLQCVVLADFRQDYGSTISQDLPKVLVPLVNTPLLDYSLDWLERSGIDEVIVYCRAQPHADLIRQHCKGFTARRAERGMNVIVVASEDCHSMGDAMRDLYAKSLLKDDFFLIHGDTIANIDLQALMAKHKERRSIDKKFIMTLLYMNKTGEHIGDDESTATLIANATTGKVLHHVRRSSSKSKLSIPAELLKTCSQLRVLPAVSDPGIAVCSEVVPSLFSDNFDYGTRDSLIRGVIEQEELLDYAIACEVLESGYATRATSLPLYETVSSEVIRRQAYPLVPEVSLTSHRIRYLYDDFTNNYWEASAKFHKGNGGRDVVVGAGSEVSLSAQLKRTVIGDHCTVQDNVKITSSFIMNNVCIKKGCVLDQCYLGDNVKLEENVVLSPGCVLGANVVLGPNITIPAVTCLSAVPPVDEFEEENTTQEPDPKICGSQGHAFVVTEDDDDDELRKLVWGREKIEEISSEEELSDEEDMDQVMGEDAHMRDEDEQREYEFRREIRESVTNALSSGSAAENVVLEINASRHAYNMSMEEVLATVTQAILRAGEEKEPEKYDSEGLWTLTKRSLSKFTDVFKNYVRKPRDQITVLNAIEALMNEHRGYLPLAQKIFYELNQVHDVLDNEVIIFWYKKESSSTPVSTTIKSLIQKFIDWLEDDEDEESEEDS
ncbi:translation initiation factor eIF2B subunit epsilon-like isoform X1 [Macrobrachium nipponense]|uniref:translation initiation factor eIF2B subunit epsilon-like isoform X1 n=1 Tax=Macrobrachium nipponense TaxID=159736 RepID=UPI0030C7B1C2